MTNVKETGWPAIQPQGRAAVSLNQVHQLLVTLPGHIPAAGYTKVATRVTLKEQMRRHHRTHHTRCKVTAGPNRSWQSGMTVLDSPHIIPSRLQQEGACHPGLSPSPKAGRGQLEVQDLRGQTSGWRPCHLEQECAAGDQTTQWQQWWWAVHPLLLHAPPRTYQIPKRRWSPPVALAPASGKKDTVSLVSLPSLLLWHKTLTVICSSKPEISKLHEPKWVCQPSTDRLLLHVHNCHFLFHCFTLLQIQHFIIFHQ